MGIPDLLNFVAREFPSSVTRLPSPQELKMKQRQQQQQQQRNGNNNNNNQDPNANTNNVNKPTFSYALVDMSNIVQTNGVQSVYDLITQQATITHAIFLVSDGNRQRAGARRERMMKMFRADKDVDMAIKQLTSQLKLFYENATSQQTAAGNTNTTSAKTATVATRRQREDGEEGETQQKDDENNNDDTEIITNEDAAAQSKATTKAQKGKNNNNRVPVPAIVNVGSDNYGEGDFKLLHLHRYLTLLSNKTHDPNNKKDEDDDAAKSAAGSKNKNKNSNSNANNNKATSLLMSVNATTGKAEGQLASPPPVDPTFLFVSEDSDLFCGALAGPSPHNVYLATTFHDLMSSLCVLSVGDCAEALATKAGIDMSPATSVLTPQEKSKCMQLVALDVITMFTILLGNGQCPPLAKGATRVDSRAVWVAYCDLRWPSTDPNEEMQQFQPQANQEAFGGEGGQDYYSFYNNNNGGSGDQTAAAQQATSSSKNSRRKTINRNDKNLPDDQKFGNFLVDVMDPKKKEQKGPSNSLVLNCELLAKVLTHFHCTDPLAHAPAAEQRKLAREYLLAVGRSAFRYCAGTTIDSREETQVQVPSLASLSYVTDDALLRFYPLTTTFAFGMNNNTASSTSHGGSSFGDATSSSVGSKNFTMTATIPGLRSENITVSFTKPAVKSQDHKFTFGELTKMFVHLTSTSAIAAAAARKKNQSQLQQLSNAQQKSSNSGSSSSSSTQQQPKEKFSFELRRMVPTSLSTLSSSGPQVGKKKSNNNNKQQQQLNNNNNNAEDDQNDDDNNEDAEFSYWDSEVMDAEEQKKKKEEEIQAKKKSMNPKQAEKQAEIEAKALEKKQEKNRKKNRKRKDKKAASKQESQPEE